MKIWIIVFVVVIIGLISFSLLGCMKLKHINILLITLLSIFTLFSCQDERPSENQINVSLESFVVGENISLTQPENLFLGTIPVKGGKDYLDIILNTGMSQKIIRKLLKKERIKNY